MRIATATSASHASAEATRAAYASLVHRLGGAPSWLVVHPTVAHDLTAILATLAELAPGVPVHGSTTCRGVISAAGFAGDAGFGLGLLGVCDPEGAFGVAVQPIAGDPRAAGREVIEAAIEAAGRAGEPPLLVWLTAEPGAEEALIAGIQDAIGPAVPIVGGSSADNDVAGAWHQLAGGALHRGAVVVSALFPSRPVHVAFHSGYSPGVESGVVTRAEGRILHEIDGRPAARVYNEWTGGAITEHLGIGGNVLALTTLNPLGRQIGVYGGAPLHRLSPPDAVVGRDALSLFTEVAVGARLIPMVGTRESLISRAGRVVRAAALAGDLEPAQIAGALVVYCAGCMFTVQADIDRVADEIRRELGEAPFLGVFTFGEQGCSATGESFHGNLMISVAVFQR